MERLFAPNGEIIKIRTDRIRQTWDFIQSGEQELEIPIDEEEHPNSVYAALVNVIQRHRYFKDMAYVTRQGDRIFLRRLPITGDAP